MTKRIYQLIDVNNFYQWCLTSAFAIFLIYVMNKTRKSLQRRFFAWIFSKFAASNLSQCLFQYKKDLFAPLNELISRDPQLAAYGPGCIRILEIGIGSGTNLRFYPSDARIISVEPNAHFKKYFEENKKKFPCLIVENFVEGTAEDMSNVADNSIDVVVSTHVLCSVNNTELCLKEILRVLVSGGKFFYAEHVSYDDETFLRFIQKWTEPLWKLFNDDCRLIVKTSQLIRNAGFSKIEENHIIIKEMPIFLTRPHIFGIATK